MKYLFIYEQKIKCFLVFFCALILTNCNTTEEIASFKIHYENGKANSISFDSNDISDGYGIFVKGLTTTPVLGEFKRMDGRTVFEPAIPFSKGQAYEIKRKDETIFDFTIASKVTPAPEVLAIYPTSDTVPENLLKMYFIFSKPMQEVGNMLDYVKVYNKTERREESIFLALENELWNTEHTQLTLWLDPGRIKNGLIPNQEKGLPIKKGTEYEITINMKLKDADRIPLANTYSKTFYVDARDELSPDIAHWKIFTPKAGTRNALTIDFKEPLDAMLAEETIDIFSIAKQAIIGTYKLANHQRRLTFVPDTDWAKGDYRIFINPILEDLAGNNLNRLFDEDLTIKKDSSTTKKDFELIFTVDM